MVMKLKLALVILTSANCLFAQDTMRAHIEAEAKALEEFDFSQYHPKVKEIMMREFEAKRAEMQARSESANGTGNSTGYADPASAAFYSRDEAKINAWYRKIPNKVKSNRRVLEVR